MARTTFTVRLNGTDTNPWHQFGLTQNPFPQIPQYKHSGYLLHVQALGGEPIPDTDYIRRHLKGYSKEFVSLCCQRFRKGEMVVFDVAFDE